LKIIFPEGAKDIDLNIPFPVDKEYTTKTFSYLDFYGRPTLIVEKANVLDYQFQEFTATYTFEKNDLLIEPLYLFAFFVASFAFFIFMGRLDLGMESKVKTD